MFIYYFIYASLYTCLCMCVCVSICTRVCLNSERAEDGTGALGAEVTEVCELPGVGAELQPVRTEQQALTTTEPLCQGGRLAS